MLGRACLFAYKSFTTVFESDSEKISGLEWKWWHLSFGSIAVRVCLEKPSKSAIFILYILPLSDATTAARFYRKGIIYAAC